MSTKYKSPDQKCGEFMSLFDIGLEWLEKAWIPYCQGKIDHKRLNTLTDEYNQRLKSKYNDYVN